jgi:serine/threonine-protein kinase HipA
VSGPVDRARVYKAGFAAAHLTRTREGTRFEYDAEYLASGRPAVATTLPPRREPLITPSGAVPPFFAGLLPEGRRLTALRRELKVSADDELSMLCAIGSDTIGDVQVVEDGGEPVPAAPMLEIPARGELDFSALLGELAPVDRVGIPGVQDKVSGRMIAVPADRAGARFILKLDPPEYPHVVENEAYLIGLARRCGLPVVDARLVRDVHGTAGLLVTRFDRVPAPDGGAVSRAAEDGCQIMGRWPADKYSMSTESLAQSVIALCAARPVAARDVFRQVAFALLTGNGDLHGKNVSVLADATGEWRVAPAYDIPSTVLYGDMTPALPLGGRRTGVSRRIMLEFAGALGLRRQPAERWLDALLAGTAVLIDAIESGALPAEQNAARRAVRELRHRRRLLAPA